MIAPSTMLWYSEALEPHPGHKSQQYSLHTISCTLLPRRQHPRSQSSGTARPPRRAGSQAQRGQSRWWTGRYHLRTALFSARSTPVAAVSQTGSALRAGRSANGASPRLRLAAAVAAAASLAVPRSSKGHKYYKTPPRPRAGATGIILRLLRRSLRSRRARPVAARSREHLLLPRTTRRPGALAPAPR